ncbi:helix-turn-helix domain-containing protein [Collimonas pratensis]|uniref:AraC family transcriptional regulator n=1 Tax=Collimonas pratensis TaxID=279113 RepID=UPI00143D9F2B|nr:AraC family transcriptional regulator [Collimonas pratensis]NKI72721.1 helix-turn-helix domain-containing protein [Collimonas pratensis]
MDPLSDVLSLLKVDSVLSARFEGCGSWAMRFPAYCHIKFGAVLEGSFWLWCEGSEVPSKFERGDFYLLTNGLPYCTASDLTKEPKDGRQIFDAYKGTDGVVRYGEGLDKVVVTGGRFTFDNDSSYLLIKQLPPLVRIPATSPCSTPLKAILDLLADETETIRPGYAISATSIANIVLVHTLRAHLAATSLTTGWFGAIKDKQIGTALSLMHGDIAKRWTVNDLATSIGLSRTVFTQRFKKFVGFSPLDYLLRWRMTVAGTELKNGTSLSKVAESVGYSSDTAFNSAFKRITGESPGRYRSKKEASH